MDYFYCDECGKRLRDSKIDYYCEECDYTVCDECSEELMLHLYKLKCLKCGSEC
ncbi:MAG: hypothetical protein ACRCVJ_18595 [Clostridium sp.]|uniref:hypothetical protein n=1 Tax=Clostridium sp. TaxID=1506 RepID=UPI003F3B966A